MIWRLLGRLNGDHHDTIATAWTHRRDKNRPRRLTDEQVRNILRRHEP